MQSVQHDMGQPVVTEEKSNWLHRGEEQMVERMVVVDGEHPGKERASYGVGWPAYATKYH